MLSGLNALLILTVSKRFLFYIFCPQNAPQPPFICACFWSGTAKYIFLLKQNAKKKKKGNTFEGVGINK